MTRPGTNPLRGMKSLNELQRREITSYLEAVFAAKDAEYDRRYLRRPAVFGGARGGGKTEAMRGMLRRVAERFRRGGLDG